jgi:DNA-binding CsgD family transcriptional regulator
VPNAESRRVGARPLLDRAEERAAIDRLVAAAGEGLSGVCVFTGDAGMGKTRLLEYALEAAPRLTRVSLAGVEAERELGYAGLHRLLHPFLVRRERLPRPQRAALESAFGLRAGAPADRFLVGLATLSLLADAVEERGLLCVVDDAQWVDRESLEALSFVARRLEADRIALLFAVRDLGMVAGVFDGLPTLHVGGLPEDASLELLSTSAQQPIDGEVARRVVVTTSGCPLALVELAMGLTQEQLLGGLLDSDALPIGRRLEDHFLRQVRELDAAAQTFLLVAAAESSGDPLLVRRAASDLGADDTAEDAAVASGLVALGPDVAFRHPLVRAAVYAGAPRSRRRAVHETLARVIDGTDPDRRVRHLAAAAQEPDEELARQLEEAAERAASRGGYAAEASFLFEAANVSPAPGERARRLLRAATAALNAGLPQRAEALLEKARPGLEDPVLVTEAMRLDGRLRVPLADPASAPARLFAAARALESIDLSLARAAYLEALDASIVSQHMTAGVSPQDIARAALATRGAVTGPPTLSDLLLDGTALLFVSDFKNAMPLLQLAASVMRDEPIARDDLARWFNLGLVIANELCDDATYNAWVSRVEHHARAVGALIVLQVALIGRAKQEMRAGQFAAAELTHDEVVEITRLVGGPPEFYELLKIDVYAWRGDESQTGAAATPLRELAAAIGTAAVVNNADISIATLELGFGRYAEALAAIESLVTNQPPGWTSLVLPIAVEAAARAGQPDRAAQYLDDLRRRATASGTDWALGQLARCRALLADDADAEDLYLEAIARLEQTTIATELAQARLAYGEWLRRQKRKIDARVQLRTAYDAFAAMGAEGFAARAHAELAATGVKVRRRVAGPVTDLTPQEAQAARLAATGATNPEIAAQMFISANTVDYHLRKVYRKLGISSRRYLANAIPPLDSPGAETPSG